MSSTTFLALAPLAVIGNSAIWVMFWNRVQSTVMPMWIVALLAHGAKVAVALLPMLVAGMLTLGQGTPLASVASVYFAFCTVVSLTGVPLAIWRRRHLRMEAKRPVEPTHIYQVQDAREASLKSSSFLARTLLGVPGNQSCEFEVNQKDLELPRLPEALDGVTITHISDLHFTGHVAKSFFDKAVDVVNELDADIIAVTGDLVDNKECLSWVPATLGRLRARHGVYVILGNHDCKQNLPNLRLILSEAGLTHLGGRMVPQEVRGTKILLAGNELPWIAPAPDMTLAPSSEESPHVRILLSHTPDEIDWARHFDFDLMLSGHTHGGQFCLPWFGPFVCPSRLPLAYAAGTLYKAPTTLHVSRGLSGLVPLRLNCRPEITRLTLRCPAETNLAGQALADIHAMQDEFSREVEFPTSRGDREHSDLANRTLERSN